MEKQEWFCLKKDVAGSQQLCAWQTTGAEATIHAMYDIFKEHNTEGIQLIDAENAFNSINGKVMFHNLKFICSIIAAYISVTYVLGGCLSLAGVNCYLMREQLKGIQHRWALTLSVYYNCCNFCSLLFSSMNSKLKMLPSQKIFQWQVN